MNTAEIGTANRTARSEEHTSELQSRVDLVCSLLLEKKKDRGLAASTLRTCHQNLQHELESPRGQPGKRTSPARAAKARLFFFFFNDTATTEIYTLSLHDALPI